MAFKENLHTTLTIQKNLTPFQDMMVNKKIRARIFSIEKILAKKLTSHLIVLTLELSCMQTEL